MGSKGSVGSSRQSSGRSSKSNLEDELIQKATHVDVTADEVVEQELLDEMVVKEVSEECGTDPGAGVVTDAKDVIKEEDEAAFTDMTGEYKPNLGSVDKRNEQFKCISNVDSEMIVKEPSTLVEDIHVESQVSIPSEITTSDKVPKDTDQISPERKEHFDTF